MDYGYLDYIVENGIIIYSINDVNENPLLSIVCYEHSALSFDNYITVHGFGTEDIYEFSFDNFNIKWDVNNTTESFVYGIKWDALIQEILTGTILTIKNKNVTKTIKYSNVYDFNQNVCTAKYRWNY